MNHVQPLHFSAAVHAPISQVWWALWNDAHYRQWTAAFSEGSYAVSDWKQGSAIHFLTPAGTGMYSRIQEKEENKKMVFSHIGEIKNFIEQPIDEKTRAWSGAVEEYVLTEESGTTKVDVTLTGLSGFEAHFKVMFPKALAILKSIAENFMLICEVTAKASLAKAWDYWTVPSHITRWNFAADDWHSPRAVNDLSAGGKFNYRMEAKDGSMGFDFEGIYISVIPKSYMEYAIADGRKVKITFSENGNATRIVQSFEPENENPLEMQQRGWQSIMDNFKKYIENP